MLGREISYVEIKRNNKTGDNDGLVGELFKYGGTGMANVMLKALYE